jgi:alcohol dehydrogenase class IV
MAITRGVFRNSTQRTVLFGAGSLEDIGIVADELGSKAAFVVAAPELASDTSFVEAVGAALGGRVVGSYHDTVAHVPRRTVVDATEAARRAGADLLISLGGGSVSDLTKMMALAIAEDIVDDAGFDRARIQYEPGTVPVVPPVSAELIPTVSLATTLSAAEFNNFAGVTDEVRKCKDLFTDDRLAPYAVVLDANLLTATPDWLLLSTGIRAVDHCIEAMMSRSAQVFTDSLAADALARLVTYLPRLRDGGRDPFDVTQCQLASWESQFASANVQYGLSHGIGHQLGARCGVPHGYTSCIMLSHVMEFNREVTEDCQARIARLLGVHAELMSSADAADAAAPALQEFIRSLGLPTTLHEVGVSEEDLWPLAEDALQDLVVATNPRRVEGPDQVVALLRNAL